MSHHCPVSGCPVTAVDDSKLMCRADWALVPKPVQRAVNLAYDRGRGLGTPALRAAQEAAIAAAERRRGMQEAPSAPAPPSPHALWEQAGGDTERYLGLMREHGHLLKPGDEGYEQAPDPLPCGWPGNDERKEPRP